MRSDDDAVLLRQAYRAEQRHRVAGVKPASDVRRRHERQEGAVVPHYPVSEALAHVTVDVHLSSHEDTSRYDLTASLDRLTVPSSSSSPHRPQFEKRCAISRTSSIVNETFLRVITVLLAKEPFAPAGPRSSSPQSLRCELGALPKRPELGPHDARRHNLPTRQRPEPTLR